MAFFLVYITFHAFIIFKDQHDLQLWLNDARICTLVESNSVELTSKCSTSELYGLSLTQRSQHGANRRPFPVQQDRLLGRH
jgi:hypothetical protein